MLRVALIADDLTGAADAGVQFAAAGYRTGVAFWGGPLVPAPDLDAVAVDTDSRELGETDAAERVAAVAESLRDTPILLKKVDSTLRGPVAAEVRAALRASGRTRLVVAPAFPATGRVTRGGVQYADGRPVAHVREALGCGGTAVLARGESVAAALDSHECVVADAEEDADLEALVHAVPDPAAVLWVGSAGLAAALGAVHPGGRRAAPPAPPAAQAVLVVIGSGAPAARAQVRRLVAAPGVVDVPLALDRADEAVTTAADALGSPGSAVVVHCTALEPAAADGPEVSRALARVVSRVAGGGALPALVLSGGETAIYVLRAIGARGLAIERELEPGVALSTVLGPRPCRVVSKAGAFGGPLTLVGAVEALGGRVGEPR